MRMLVRFGKNPRLRFISHLDLQRFMQMALNRSGLPVAFSQGFNPHPLMSFASALALGWTSEYEVLDVRLSVPMGRGRCEEAMRRALPPDLPVLEVRMVEDRRPAAMAQVAAADYRVSLLGDGASQICGEIPEFLRAETVLAMKKTKSGEKEINIRPLVLSMEPEADGFRARLALKEGSALKADLLAQVMAQRLNVPAPEMRIHRRTLMGLDEAGALRPLMEL